MAERNFQKTTVVITIDIQPVDDCSHRLHYLRDAVHRLLEDHLKYMSTLYEGDRTHFTTPDTDARMQVLPEEKEHTAFVGKSDLLIRLAIDREIPIRKIDLSTDKWLRWAFNVQTDAEMEEKLKEMGIPPFKRETPAQVFDWPMDLASNTADPEFVKKILEGYEEEGGDKK